MAIFQACTLLGHVGIFTYDLERIRIMGTDEIEEEENIDVWINIED